MSIINLQNKIISNADNEALEIIKVAEIEAKKIIEKAQAEKEEILKSVEESLKLDKENIIKRKASVASIDGRKSSLLNKQNLIDKCFNQAMNHISSMDRDKYIDVLVKMSKGSGLTEGILTFNEKDKNEIGNIVVARLNEEISDGNFTLDENTAKIIGGYFISTKKIRINNSIEAVVSDKKKELIQEVSKILFD